MNEQLKKLDEWVLQQKVEISKRPDTYVNQGFILALDVVIGKINELMKDNSDSQWIDVNTDLPNIEIDVLVFHKTQGCIIMRLEYDKSENLIWYDAEGQKCDFELITHFKPLPNPPNK